MGSRFFGATLCAWPAPAKIVTIIASSSGCGPPGGRRFALTAGSSRFAVQLSCMLSTIARHGPSFFEGVGCWREEKNIPTEGFGPSHALRGSKDYRYHKE